MLRTPTKELRTSTGQPSPAGVCVDPYLLGDASERMRFALRGVDFQLPRVLGRAGSGLFHLRHLGLCGTIGLDERDHWSSPRMVYANRPSQLPLRGVLFGPSHLVNTT
jgi:hypothetical protein